MWLVHKEIEKKYINACKQIITNTENFNTFKRNKDYQLILSGGEKIIGDEAIKKIKRYNKFNELKNDLIKLKYNDSLGLPILHHYNLLGMIDPSSLKYYSDYIELKNFIQEKQIDNIIEIGGGYGGLALILNMFFKIKSYHLIDLEMPLKLQFKYLNQLVENKNTFNFYNEINNIKVQNFDLLIADASLAELDENKINQYFSLIKKSQNVFISFNTLHLKQCRSNFKSLIKKIKENFFYELYYDHWNKVLIFGSKKKLNFKLQKNYSHYINYFYYKIFRSINNFF